MKKTYENSRLEWLTNEDIEANNESESVVIVQVSEKIACPVIRIENNLQCEICFLCEIVDREEYEKTTQKGKIKELEKKVRKLKGERDILSQRLDTATAITAGEIHGRQKAEETIEEMKAGFRELERVFGDLPPEIVSLYRIPDREG